MDLKTKKKLWASFLSIAILAGTLFAADAIIKQHTTDGVRQSMAIYDQPKNSIDVLVLGSSHAYYGINTAKLWEDYGIAAYDFGSAEQSLWVSYHYLIEACKRQKPGVVVLDFYSPAAYQEDHKFKYTFLADALYGMKFSFNKLAMMNACFDGDRDLWNKYFPSFFGYHDQYEEVTAEDFEKLFTDHADFKGYVPHFSKASVSGFEVSNEEILPPSDKSVKYLKKIVDYTRKHNMELYITIAPYRLNDEQTVGIVQEEDKRYNWLEQYVAELRAGGDEHVYFDYTLKHMDSFGILMAIGEDMHDATHLNYYGSCKFTDYLGKDLKERYGEELIPDHRGDEKYVSWDENVEIVKKDVADNGFEWR